MPSGFVTPAGGGNTTSQVVASGKVLPVADATGVTVDTTTYNDTIRGSGKLTTLVFPATTEGALAFAISGDAFPRLLMASDPGYTAMSLGDGTFDPSANNAGFAYHDANTIDFGRLRIQNATAGSNATPLNQVSSRFSITSGALPTQQLVTATGAQLADPGSSRDVESITPFTGDGTNNVASLVIALSPDDLTYSTLDTLSIAAALNLTGVLALSANVRVPGGWYLKLTATHGTIGLTTYY